MLGIFQKTLSKNVRFEGIGLHTGKSSTVNLLPAKENHGIVFKRIDLNKNNLVEANFSNVSSAKLCTTLENSYGVKVSTVEHLILRVDYYVQLICRKNLLEKDLEFFSLKINNLKLV